MFALPGLFPLNLQEGDGQLFSAGEDESTQANITYSLYKNTGQENASKSCLIVYITNEVKVNFVISAIYTYTVRREGVSPEYEKTYTSIIENTPL